jgi:hypothetical protein
MDPLLYAREHDLENRQLLRREVTPRPWRETFHARKKNPPGSRGDQVAGAVMLRRRRPRLTCIGNHRPQFGAAMPRVLRSTAIALLDVRPVASSRPRHVSSCGHSEVSALRESFVICPELTSALVASI